jgi:hypothetical protein
MNKEAASRKMLKSTTKEQAKNLSKCLNIVKPKWLNKIKNCKYIVINNKGYYRNNPQLIGK